MQIEGKVVYLNIILLCILSDVIEIYKVKTLLHRGSELPSPPMDK